MGPFASSSSRRSRRPCVLPSFPRLRTCFLAKMDVLLTLDALPRLPPPREHKKRPPRTPLPTFPLLPKSKRPSLRLPLQPPPSHLLEHHSSKKTTSHPPTSTPPPFHPTKNASPSLRSTRPKNTPRQRSSTTLRAFPSSPQKGNTTSTPYKPQSTVSLPTTRNSQINAFHSPRANSPNSSLLGW